MITLPSLEDLPYSELDALTHLLNRVATEPGYERWQAHVRAEIKRRFYDVDDAMRFAS